MNHRIAIWLLALASSASSLLPAQDISASYQWKPVKLGGGGFVTGMAIHPSKGGPTYAAITSMDQSQVKALFGQALHAAERRARELGEEFGRD